MALSSKNAKPLVQLKFDAFNEAANALKDTTLYENVVVNGVSAQEFAEALHAKCDELQREYYDILE